MGLSLQQGMSQGAFCSALADAEAGGTIAGAEASAAAVRRVSIRAV
jgi:hypothetical protein